MSAGLHTGLPTPTEGNSALENIRMDMENLTQSLIELGVIVHDYVGEEGTQVALEHKAKDLVSELRSAAQNADSLENTAVPTAVIEYLEDGRNPDIYSREFIETLVMQNQFIRGKMVAMAQFKDILVAQLSEQFDWMKDDLQNAAKMTAP